MWSDGTEVPVAAGDTVLAGHVPSSGVRVNSTLFQGRALKHVFLGIDDDGVASVVKTMGNPGAHLILRGGKRGPNYDAESVAAAQRLLEKRGLAPNLIVDCSHANSNKDHRMQPVVFNDVMEQRASNPGVVGLMLEGNINEGSQSLGDPAELDYGVSITDACIAWPETVELVRTAHARLGA